MKNIFYVYIYLNPLEEGIFVYGDIQFNYKPFYIGKGKNNRYLEHLKEVKNENNIKEYERHKIIKKILDNKKEPIIIKLHENLNESQALNLEEYYINIVGQENLTNLKSGGKIQEGYKHTEETKSKISKSSKNRVSKNFILIDPDGNKYDNVCLSEFCRNKNLNFHKLRKSVNKGKIKINNSGFKAKQETKNCNNWEIIRDDVENRKTINFILTSPEGDIFKIKHLENFCSKHDLDYRTMREHRNLGKIKISKRRAKKETKNCNNWKIVNISNNTIADIKKSKRKNKYIITSPHNKTFFVNNLKQFCENNNLNIRTFRSFINRGKINMVIRKTYHHKILNSIGWEIKTI